MLTSPLWSRCQVQTATALTSAQFLLPMSLLREEIVPRSPLELVRLAQGQAHAETVGEQLTGQRTVPLWWRPATWPLQNRSLLACGVARAGCGELGQPSMVWGQEHRFKS